MNLPWWLNPWRVIKDMQHRIDSLCEAANMDIRTIQHLEQENSKLLARNAVLARQIRNMAAPVGSGRSVLGWESPGQAVPEFVMCGMDRGAGRGKRLYASRDLGGTNFGMTGEDDPPPRYVLRSAMANTLVIDKPTYGEAMDHMAAIWRNWDSTALPSPGTKPGGRQASQPKPSQASHQAIDPGPGED